MGECILLVDDDQSSLELLSRLCRIDGHDVHTATTVQEALRVQAEQRCRLIVTDLGLPDGTGVELMRQVREMYRTPCIALTGWGEGEFQIADGEFCDYLAKPILYERLRSAIESAMRQ